MGRRNFAIVWTALACGGAFLVVRKDISGIANSPAVIVLVLFFPFVGVLFFLSALHDIRRRRTLRRVTENGVAVWVWIGLGGTSQRSDSDPTPSWEAAGGDGDGGGDWGHSPAPTSVSARNRRTNSNSA